MASARVAMCARVDLALPLHKTKRQGTSVPQGTIVSAGQPKRSLANLELTMTSFNRHLALHVLLGKYATL